VADGVGCVGTRCGVYAQRRKAELKRLRQEEAARLLAKQRAAYALRLKQGAAFPLNSTVRATNRAVLSSPGRGADPLPSRT